MVSINFKFCHQTQTELRYYCLVESILVFCKQLVEKSKVYTMTCDLQVFVRRTGIIRKFISTENCLQSNYSFTENSLKNKLTLQTLNIGK